MDFPTLDIDGREGTHWAVVLASSTPYTTLFVDGHHAVSGAGIAHDADSSGRAMARASVALHALCQEAVVRHCHRIADADAGLFRYVDRLDSPSRTDFAATSTTHTAEALVESHLRLHQGFQILRGTQHLIGAFAHTKLAASAAT